MRDFPAGLDKRFLELRLLVDGVDLTHRLYAWDLDFNFDAGSWQLELRFRNPRKWVEEGLGLDPRDVNSVYNQRGPLLGCYRPVQLDIRKAGDAAWYRAFDGWIGPSEVAWTETWEGADEVRATCVGVSQPLKDHMIEQRLALRYRDGPISKHATPDLLTQILRDQGLYYEIEYRDDPNYMVTDYIISNVSAWEALQNAVAPTGFRLVELYSPTRGRFVLTVKDPLRFKTTPDIVYSGGFSSRSLSGSEADVRTYVAVVYQVAGSAEERYVWREASPSIVARYGIPDGRGGRTHRKMVYRTSERSLVDSASEAMELASYILWDLSEPTPNIEVEFPVLDLRVEPFDLIRTIDEAGLVIDIGVMSVRHSWTWDRPVGMTTVTGAKGKVIGARESWLCQDVRKGGLSAIEDTLKSLTTDPTAVPERPDLRPAWFVGPDGTPVAVLDALLTPSSPWWLAGRRVRIQEFRPIDHGTATGGGPGFLEDASKFWQPGQFSSSFGDWVVLTAGPGRGQERRVRQTTPTRIEPDRPFDPPPGPGTAYVVLRRTRRTAELTLDTIPYARILGWPEDSWLGVSEAFEPQGRS